MAGSLRGKQSHADGGASGASLGGPSQKKKKGVMAKGKRLPTKPNAHSRSHGQNEKILPERKDGAASSLNWKAVDLPGEAAAMAGETDADFFKGFSAEDDDFLGLTELEGVQVVKDGDGNVRLVHEQDAKGKRREQQQQKSTQKAASTSQDDKTRPPSQKQRVDASGTGDVSTIPAIDLPPVDFYSDVDKDTSDEEKESESRAASDSAAEDSHQDVDADFRILAAQDESAMSDDDSSAQKTWTGKTMGKRLPAWKKLQIRPHARICQALESLSFKTPTNIQAASLPASVPVQGSGRDVVGIAQTGSGKTLAYALPVLHWLASTTTEDRQMQLIEEVGTSIGHGIVRLSALILAPTRELALQVTKHIETFIAASSSEQSKLWASVAAVTGGISEEKQRRLLLGHHGRGVDIIVATPGRLWDMCRTDDNLTRRIKATRFLVVDEADRMIETGHFAEMDNILSLVRRAEQVDTSETAETFATARVRGGASDMQTLIFSATLSKELQHNLKRAKRSNKRRHGAGSTLDDLIDAIDFRDEDPLVVDLSTRTRIASTVVEVKAECLAKDKDLYLYYFLLRYPGRTLVFVNSIDGIRRLQPLLANLAMSVQPLHSQLQQKQRLKHLERFRASRLPSINSSAVLLATDVAARGLDIPAVDHVVHFQLPRSTDTYVHRSGRTARAGKTGVSLALIDPSEKRLWRDLCRNLKRDDTLPSMPIEYSFLPVLRERIELAREIDRVTHKQNKEAHDDGWLRKLAAEVDIDMSDDDGDNAGNKKSKQSGKNTEDSAATSSNNKRNIATLRAELDSLLKQPLRARGISFKYLTGGSSDFLEGILADTQHDKMIGVQRSTVQGDFSSRKAHAGSLPKPAVSKRKRDA